MSWLVRLRDADGNAAGPAVKVTEAVARPLLAHVGADADTVEELELTDAQLTELGVVPQPGHSGTLTRQP